MNSFLHNEANFFQSTEVIGHEPGVVVGVVGLGHLNGIKENFGKQVDIEELLR